MSRHSEDLRADSVVAGVAGQQRLGRLIADYLRAVESGTAPAPEEFIRQNVDVADGLRSFFACQDMPSPPAERKAETATIRPGDDSSVASVPELGRTTQDDVTLCRDAPRRDSPLVDDAVRYFGDYELLEEIARGGMGVVYRARQISLNRTVALKMILAGQLAGDEDVERFHAEAEAAANLDHPGIVPIHEVGEFNGQHYFSMGYVEGPSLAQEVSRGPLSPRTAARLTRQVSEAVAFAHQHGVIHRDLKPANVLLDAEGHPRVTDFGLAKRVSGDSDLTATGQVLGTPSYMPPEQAAGKISQIGPKSDIYSVGAILYELVSGRPPFHESNPIDTLIQVLDTQPVPLRLIDPEVPRDLETICLKCLEKDAAHRYDSAQELTEDLDRFLQGELIHASSVNLLGRAARALVHSHHEEYFQGWGMALVALGAIIFLAHLATHFLSASGASLMVAYWTPRVAMFAAIFILLWYVRPQSILPTGATERPIWAVWIGYLLALGTLNLVISMHGVEQTELFAYSAILSGFGFFVMGSHVWGGSYIIGCGFWAAAPLLARFPNTSAFWFGTLWGIALTAFGLRYWQRGRQAFLGDRQHAASHDDK